MTSSFPPCFYRVSAKALIVKDGKVLLIQESDGRWELPGGGLEVGESFTQGISREIKEEIGVNVTEVSAQPVYAWSLLDEDPEKGVRPKLILAFMVKVDSYNFSGNPDESSNIQFFSKEQIGELKLHPNIEELPKVLDI